ncbi:hypothetical protein CGMCC3_g16694 [Colletotrichum fructicola]|nr:uncharacterized protein CGMCC3_g16694 [Colletotrichum fructicola]KAE9567181.1 hypothetical protein CGMCC3_g16694 [Colletotrichum fructicola]
MPQTAQSGPRRTPVRPPVPETWPSKVPLMLSILRFSLRTCPELTSDDTRLDIPTGLD